MYIKVILRYEDSEFNGMLREAKSQRADGKCLLTWKNIYRNCIK